MRHKHNKMRWGIVLPITLTPLLAFSTPIWPQTIDFGLIWPYNPLPVLHCPVFVCFCKVHPKPPMLLGQKRLFLLGYSLHSSASKCSLYCFHMKECVGHVLQNFGDLSGIFSLLRSDKMNSILGVGRWKLLLVILFPISPCYVCISLYWCTDSISVCYYLHRCIFNPESKYSISQLLTSDSRYS